MLVSLEKFPRTCDFYCICCNKGLKSEAERVLRAYADSSFKEEFNSKVVIFPSTLKDDDLLFYLKTHNNLHKKVKGEDDTDTKDEDITECLVCGCSEEECTCDDCGGCTRHCDNCICAEINNLDDDFTDIIGDLKENDELDTFQMLSALSGSAVLYAYNSLWPKDHNISLAMKEGDEIAFHYFTSLERDGYETKTLDEVLNKMKNDFYGWNLCL